MNDPNTPTATLIVSASSSKCSRCRRGTSLSPTHHTRVIGYGVTEPTRGCGARFTAITYGQLGQAERLAELVGLRPDLPLVVPVWMTIPDNPDAVEAERRLHAALDGFRAAITAWKDAGGDDPALHLIGEQRREEAYVAAGEFDDTIVRLRREAATSEVIVGAGSPETSALTNCPTCGTPEWHEDGRRGWNPVDVECEDCASVPESEDEDEG